MQKSSKSYENKILTSLLFISIDLNNSGAEFTTTIFGNLALIYKGVSYIRKHTKSTHGKIYWECSQRKKYKCHARISQWVDSGKLILTNLQHNHKIEKNV